MQTLRPSTAPLRLSKPSHLHHLPTNPTSRRTFLSNPFSTPGPQKILAARTIAHPPRQIYRIISDVDAYSSFIPYCQSSRVTRTSSPSAKTGLTYPEEAELAIGFTSSVSETFWSRIYCVPDEVIETVCGPETETRLKGEEIAHHSARPENREEDRTRSASVLAHLRTRWGFRPLGGKETEVSLEIEYEFANPVYAALSQAAAPQVAEKVIEAFEQRVRTVMEGRGQVVDTR